MTDAKPRLIVRRDAGIGRITLAAPEKRNAVDLDWCRQFADAALTLAGDDSVRVVVLDAEGDWFSVGGDIDYFIAQREVLRTKVLEMAALFHLGIERLHFGGAALVASVAGTAAGGGFSLACGADLILAGIDARFISAYSSSGLSPDGGLTYFLPRIVGLRRAFEIIALNPVLTAQAACDLGIVTRVVANAALADETEKTVQALAALPAGALASVKRLLAESPTSSLPQQLDRESRGISALAASPATQAVLDRFLARRTKG